MASLPCCYVHLQRHCNCEASVGTNTTEGCDPPGMLLKPGAGAGRLCAPQATGRASDSTAARSMLLCSLRRCGRCAAAAALLRTNRPHLLLGVCSHCCSGRLCSCCTPAASVWPARACCIVSQDPLISKKRALEVPKLLPVNLTTLRSLSSTSNDAWTRSLRV